MKIEIHVPYTKGKVKSGPFKGNINIGACYNHYMKKAEDVCIFRDSDVYTDLLRDPLWFDVYQNAINYLDEKDPKWGALICFTSRIGCMRQQVLNPKVFARFNKLVKNPKKHIKKMPKPQHRNLDWHKVMAQAVWDVYGGKPHEVPIAPAYMSGFMFATNKRSWLKTGGFRGGFYGVDVNYAKQLFKKGLKMYRVGLYVFHGYETSKIKKGG